MDIAGIKTQTYKLSYDKIVKNMLAQSDGMTIKFINGLFGDNILDDASVEWLDKETVDDQYKAIVADLYPRINGQMYTVEIESDDNGGMALRIFKYSVGGVLRHSLLESDSEVTIDFPKPCVVFLKSDQATPERLTWNINFFDGQKVTVTVPTLRLAELSVHEMAERSLFPVGQFFLRTFEPLTKSNLNDFREAAQLLMSELKNAVDSGVIPAHIGLKIQDNIRQTAENTISRSRLEGVDLAMASSVMETLTCIDYDEVFHQLEERGRNEGIAQGRNEGITQGRNEGIAQGRNALAMDMAVMAFRQKGRMQKLVVGDLKMIGISEQIINAAKDLVEKEKTAEYPKQKRGRSEPER